MIRINIEVDTAAQARSIMNDLLGYDNAPSQPTAEQTPAPKSATRGKKAPAEETSATQTSPAAATSQKTPSSAAVEDKGSTNSLDKDALAARCTAYGQKAGREALKQLFIVLGAPNGKWSEVPADKYAALDASLTDYGF